MKVKLYFESGDGSMGGHEIVSIFKLMWWLLLGRINPKEDSARYYIRKITTVNGKRI